MWIRVRFGRELLVSACGPGSEGNENKRGFLELFERMFGKFWNKCEYCVVRRLKFLCYVGDEVVEDVVGRRGVVE